MASGAADDPPVRTEPAGRDIGEGIMAVVAGGDIDGSNDVRRVASAAAARFAVAGTAVVVVADAVGAGGGGVLVDAMGVVLALTGVRGNGGAATLVAFVVMSCHVCVVIKGPGGSNKTKQNKRVSRGKKKQLW